MTTTTARRQTSTTTTRPQSTTDVTSTSLISAGPEYGSGPTVYFLRDSKAGAEVQKLDVATGRVDRASINSTLRGLSLGRSGEFAGLVDSAGGTSILVGKLGSSQTRTLDVPGSAVAAAISPDGTRVAFASDARGNDDILLLDLSSHRTQTVAGTSADETDPAWIDDHHLAYVSKGSSAYVPGGDEVWALEVNGITAVTTMETAPGQPPSGTDLIDNSDGAKSGSSEFSGV